LSLEQLESHRRIWKHKPVLRGVYGVWFDALLAHAPPDSRVLEVGSGPGFLSEHARHERPDLAWIASDLTSAGWNDLAADAARLPIRDGGLDAILGLDVIHHLARPYGFLAEATRALRPGGRLVLLEPWITPLSFPVYRWFHQESCRLGCDPADPFASSPGVPKPAFEGDAAVLWRVVKVTRAEEWSRLRLGPPDVEVLNGFAYLLSLGFRERSLLPRTWLRHLLRLDRVAGPLAPLAGMRALAVWERQGGR
jgi:SAM-dependent methyltransferase